MRPVPEPPPLHNSPQRVQRRPPEAPRWTRLTHTSHTHACADTHARSAPHRSGVRTPARGVNIWVAVATSGSAEGGKRPLCVFPSPTAWPRVHTRLQENQTYHCRRGRCGARNERVQPKLLIYLDGRRMRRQTELNEHFLNVPPPPPPLMDYVKSETVSRDARPLSEVWIIYGVDLDPATCGTTGRFM